jgi:hypothetical protein
MGIKRNAADKWLSDCVRESVGWTCERCKKYFPEGRGRAGLHLSHFYGRGGKSVRYFPDNCDSLCYGCHKFMERSRDEYKRFKLKKLGDVRYEELVLRANSPRKYSKADIKEMSAHYRSQYRYMQRRRAEGERGYLPLVRYD